MDGESFAEKLKKFNQKPVMGIRISKPHITHNESSLDLSQPEKSERLKSNDFNQSFDDINSTKSDYTTSSSKTSLPHDTNLAQTIVSGLKKSTITLPKSPTIDRNENKHSESSNHLQDTTRSSSVSSNVISNTNLKKPPVVLPKSFTNNRNENKQSELLAISQDTILYYPYPSKPNTFTDVKKPPVSLPVSVNSDSSSNLDKEEMPSPVISSNTNKGSVLSSNSIHLDQHEDNHNEFISISLNTMLSPKCMFYKFESSINDYKRRDPRTIIYQKMKVPMPKISTNEINILQRYSNK
ncbi:unnamed protein product [Rotaria sordida]|uniref:Uncharacterized protein n=1 Tax=Rotaria sordida TaxID=392033 RepID=A0A813RGX9_9BILA|nr:unnamed protein product [Rotaria sordida]CAF3571869.1 unnamed protein product [Rotaria sordida]